MINTPMFASYKRYELLNEARLKIKSEHNLHPYNWMLNLLNSAIEREIKFMRNNKTEWLGEELEEK